MRRWIAAFAVLAIAGVVGAPLANAATSWPAFGGDVGRSGFQTIDEGGVPVQFAWARASVADQDIRTSLVIGSGDDPANQRMVYGTENGRLHVRRLLTGAEVGPAGGTDISAAANPFGGGTASVTPVEAGRGDGLGQVYAVHNQRYVPPEPLGTPGLQIARLDEETGTVAQNIDLSAAAGFVIESSPVLTPPDAADTRSLFFVARQEGGTLEQLFKIDITNASSSGAVIGALTSTPDINANSQASPTLVWLKAADGTPTLYVAVGTIDSLRTFRASDLAAGPTAVGLGENVRSASTPITSTGNAPGSAGSGLAVTPAIYVASGNATSTFVHKLTQASTSQTLTVATSAALDGEGANALMTDQRASIAGTTDGRVYVTTSKQLAALRTTDLTVALSRAGSFRDTTASATGALVTVAADNGSQLVLQAEDLAPVAPELFVSSSSNDGSKTSFGSPAIASRFLAFASDKGVFVYALRRAFAPTGYWLVASDGGLFAYGDAGFYGSTGAMKLNKPIVGMALTPTRKGYWMVASDGGIFSFGDAGFFGSTGSMDLNKPIVGMAATPTGQGYWLVASDGGIFSFGDATFFGSTGAMTLNKPIVAMGVTITGQGYWLVASDGGIFAFGDAPFFGSTGAMTLNKPIVGMAPEPNGRGYWLVGSDGGVFSFGRVGFFGSTGDLVLNSPIVSMGASATGLGYLFTAADGGVFNDGDAPFFGAAASLGKLNRPVVALAVNP